MIGAHARPRRRAARRRHGAVRDPLRRARAAARGEARRAGHGRRQRRLAGRGDRLDGRREGSLSRPDPRPLRPARRRSLRRPPAAGRCRSCSAATTPVALGSLGRHGAGARARRRRLGRRPRRPQHARDVADRQRPRDGARGGSRPRRRLVRGATAGRYRRSTTGRSRSSASARSTTASGSSCGGSTRRSSR